MGAVPIRFACRRRRKHGPSRALPVPVPHNTVETHRLPRRELTALDRHCCRFLVETRLEDNVVLVQQPCLSAEFEVVPGKRGSFVPADV